MSSASGSPPNVITSGQPAPHHDDPLEPVAHQIVATWPPGTFVENLAPLPDGDFVVSLHSRRELARVRIDGSRSTLAHLPVSPVGIVVDGDRLVVGGGEIGTTPQTVFTIGLDGHVQPLVEVPDSLFLNGFTPARAGFVYCVDSLLGVVFEIDLAAASARVVLHHDLLGKISADPMMPGVNGIALGDDALWLTNTDRAVVLRAGLGADGPDGRSTSPRNTCAATTSPSTRTAASTSPPTSTTHWSASTPTVGGSRSPARSKACTAPPPARSASEPRTRRCS